MRRCGVVSRLSYFDLIHLLLLLLKKKDLIIAWLFFLNLNNMNIGVENVENLNQRPSELLLKVSTWISGVFIWCQEHKWSRMWEKMGRTCRSLNLFFNFHVWKGFQIKSLNPRPTVNMLPYDPKFMTGDNMRLYSNTEHIKQKICCCF